MNKDKRIPFYRDISVSNGNRCLSLDISKHGMCFIANKSIPINSVIEISSFVPLPFGHSTHLEGIVVYCITAPYNSEYPYRIGVRFIHPEQKKRVHQLIKAGQHPIFKLLEKILK